MQFVVMALFALVSCATPPREPYYASEIRDIRTEDLGNYWKPTKRIYRFGADREALSLNRDGLGGFVVGAIVIDSNGRVTDIRIVQSEPDERLIESYKTLVRMTRYEAADDNQARVPVRVMYLVTFGLSRETAEKIEELGRAQGW